MHLAGVYKNPPWDEATVLPERPAEVGAWGRQRTMINPNYYPWGYDSDNGERGAAPGPLLPAPAPGRTGPRFPSERGGGAGSRARGSAGAAAEAAWLSLAGAEKAKLVAEIVSGRGSLR